MRIRPEKHLLLPLLVLGLTFATAMSGHAQERQYQRSGGTSATLRVSFGTAPHWASVSGTRVEEIRQAERPDYDMFRYGGSYYAYDNNQWYTSQNDQGDFAAIDDRSVPTELTMVPRDHWRSYPSAWMDGNGNPRYQGAASTSASLQVRFGTTPRWAAISGTRVEEISQAQRPDYDMFRYDGNYYAYDNDQWYTSRNDRGDFEPIDDRMIPNELTSVPRDHWRNYPSGWADQYDNSPYRRTGGTSASMQISFGTSPRWTGIRGTRVRMIRQDQRPGYDMFLYGGRYYVYNDNRWYMSNNQRGRYLMVDERSVPFELSRVPRRHWRNYPAVWSDQDRQGRYGGYGQHH